MWVPDSVCVALCLSRNLSSPEIYYWSFSTELLIEALQKAHTWFKQQKALKEIGQVKKKTEFKLPSLITYARLCII